MSALFFFTFRNIKLEWHGLLAVRPCKLQSHERLVTLALSLISNSTSLWKFRALDIVNISAVYNKIRRYEI